MFIIKTKSGLPVLVVTLAFAGIGAAPIGQTPAGEQPQTKEEQAGKTDEERIVGSWAIVNDDSKRKGEGWVISEDRILMYANFSGMTAVWHFHRLDAGKDPKQIDITVTKVNGSPSSPIGIIKGIYALDGDELRLCLGEMGKDRPKAFPEKPGPGEVLILQRGRLGASPPKAKEEKPAPSDQERMVGEWFIMNAESKAQGQLWVIHKDHLLMNYYGPGLLAKQFHFLDPDKDPKQIDIAFTPVNGPHARKGIYVLDGEELRLCLGERGKDRPAAFPEKPGPDEVLILQRAAPGGGRPKAKKEIAPAKEPDVLTPEVAIQQRDQEEVTVQFKVAAVETIITSGVIPKGAEVSRLWVRLKDGKNFSVQLRGRVTYQIERLGIDPARHFSNKVVRATGQVQHIESAGTFQIVVNDLDQIEVILQPQGNEEPPAAKKDQKESQEKPAKDEQLRALIDNVLEAHGGEDKLNKLTSFTMSVKHSNGETQHYFVQPPKNFRWETTHPDRTGKRIVILFPEGRRWWTKEPGGAPREFHPTGAEPRMEFWLDYVKFFGPRQVLRLKDADHKVKLLDEEAKIDERAAMGVQVTGPQYDHKLYFDKETNLLLKGVGSDIVREVTYSDYKKIDGIPIAQREHEGHFEPEVTDFRAVDKFDAKLFIEP